MQAGAYGFVLSLSSGLDLTTATAVTVRIERPDFTVLEAALPLPAGITDAANGKVAYQVVQGDLPLAGIYRVQVIDATPGRHLPSAVSTFVLEPNVEAV